MYGEVTIVYDTSSRRGPLGSRVHLQTAQRRQPVEHVVVDDSDLVVGDVTAEDKYNNIIIIIVKLL